MKGQRTALAFIVYGYLMHSSSMLRRIVHTYIHNYQRRDTMELLCL